MNEPFRWRERAASEFTCVRCLEPKPAIELDRLRWCEACVARCRARTARRAWIGGAAVALLVAAYILLDVRPDFSLVPAVWFAIVVAVFYLGFRITRELLYGFERLLNRPAVEARPPSAKPGDERS